MTTKQGKRRVGSRLIPAVDYLQSQRLRMMMMQELYEATKDVDAYIVASGPSRGAYRTPPKPGGMGGGGGGGGGGAGESMSASRRHSSMANLATYPAINLPNGFDSKGSPTNVTVFAQPYKEDIVLGAKKHNQHSAVVVRCWINHDCVSCHVMAFNSTVVLFLDLNHRWIDCCNNNRHRKDRSGRDGLSRDDPAQDGRRAVKQGGEGGAAGGGGGGGKAEGAEGEALMRSEDHDSRCSRGCCHCYCCPISNTSISRYRYR